MRHMKAATPNPPVMCSPSPNLRDPIPTCVRSSQHSSDTDPTQFPHSPSSSCWHHFDHRDLNVLTRGRDATAERRAASLNVLLTPGSPEPGVKMLSPLPQAKGKGPFFHYGIGPAQSPYSSSHFSSLYFSNGIVCCGLRAAMQPPCRGVVP